MQRGARTKLEHACAKAKNRKCTVDRGRTRFCRIAGFERQRPSRSRSRNMAKRTRKEPGMQTLWRKVPRPSWPQICALTPLVGFAAMKHSFIFLHPVSASAVGESAGAQRDGPVANHAEAWHLSTASLPAELGRCSGGLSNPSLLLSLAHLPLCLPPRHFGPLTAGPALPLFSTARVGISLVQCVFQLRVLLCSGACRRASLAIEVGARRDVFSQGWCNF